ncbi:hypothetical protein ACLB2K_005818 [Fragaria x ananassa]
MSSPWSLRICGRHRRGFGFVIVNGSAFSPWRFQLPHRRGFGFGFVAVKVLVSSPLRLLLRHCRGFGVVVKALVSSSSSRLQGWRLRDSRRRERHSYYK